MNYKRNDMFLIAVAGASLIAFASLFGGCACSKPENKGKLGCQLLSQTVDCASKSVQDQLPKFIPEATQIIRGQGAAVNWTSVIGKLVGLFGDMTGCLVAYLEADMVKGKQMTNPELSRLVEEWNKLHPKTTYRFK